MKCRCEAQLETCDPQNQRCPASAFRLRWDYQAAVAELRQFMKMDADGVPVRGKSVPTRKIVPRATTWSMGIPKK